MVEKLAPGARKNKTSLFGEKPTLFCLLSFRIYHVASDFMDWVCFGFSRCSPESLFAIFVSLRGGFLRPHLVAMAAGEGAGVWAVRLHRHRAGSSLDSVPRAFGPERPPQREPLPEGRGESANAVHCREGRAWTIETQGRGAGAVETSLGR